jgi:hypothetical protein
MSPIKDFEPALFTNSIDLEQKTFPNKRNSLDLKVSIDEYFWLKNDLTIIEWLDLVETKVDKDAKATDYWK